MKKLLLFLGAMGMALPLFADVGDVTVINTISPKNNAFQYVVRSTNVYVSTAPFNKNLGPADVNLQHAMQTLDQLTAGGGTGTPSNPEKSVQFNSGGVFAGTGTLTMDTTANLLTVASSAAFTNVNSVVIQMDTMTFQNGTDLQLQYTSTGTLLGTDANSNVVTTTQVSSLTITNLNTTTIKFNDATTLTTYPLKIGAHITGGHPGDILFSNVGSNLDQADSFIYNFSPTDPQFLVGAGDAPDPVFLLQGGTTSQLELYTSNLGGRTWINFQDGVNGNEGYFGIRPFDQGSDLRGFTWADASKNYGMKLEYGTPRLHIGAGGTDGSSYTYLGTATLNVKGSAVVGSDDGTITPITNGLVVKSSVQVNGLTASQFVKTDGSKVLVSSAAVNLATEVSGNLSVNNLNSGTGATSSTFWRGDGTWGTPSTSGGIAGSTAAITMVFDGGGSAIVAGSTSSLTIPFACTISSWTVLEPRESGSITIGVKKATYAAFPTLTDMVGAGNAPSLSSAQKNTAAPASWTSITFSAGDTVSFVPSGVTSVTWVSIILWVVRT